MGKRRTSNSVTSELARLRSRQAADRTLMAWVRTALSLIAFGFGIDKFRDFLVREEVMGSTGDATSLFGLGFITLGVLGLAAGMFQHMQSLARIRSGEFRYVSPAPMVLIMAVLLLVIGLFAFVVVLVR